MITQQLDALSLEELLELRARVDALIEEKASPFSKGQQPSSSIGVYSVVKHTGSYRGATSVSSEMADIDYFVTIPASSVRVNRQALFLKFLEHNKPNESQVAQLLEIAANEEDDSLEKVIEMVDEWMTDESGYDEETYPQIEAALNQNGLSL